MREFNYKLNEVLDLGYFEAHRLWTIIEEIKSRDFQILSIVLDHPHTSQDKRKEIWDWLESKQARKTKKTFIPKEVLEKFADAFNKAKKRL